MEEPYYDSSEPYEAPAEKKSNTGLIIAIVVAVILLCCCCTIAAIAGYSYLSSEGIVQALPLLLAA